MSEKGSVNKAYIWNKNIPLFKMKWKAKIRSQLKVFNDKHVVELPHAVMAEEIADWLSNKVKA